MFRRRRRWQGIKVIGPNFFFVAAGFTFVGSDFAQRDVNPQDARETRGVLFLFSLVGRFRGGIRVRWIGEASTGGGPTNSRKTGAVSGRLTMVISEMRGSG